MSPSLPVVLYHYETSPFANKIRIILLFKQIPHSRVDVFYIPPRPALSELLGITYRRIPVLAIGNDVYCDTSLIVSALERRFPAAEGHETLFPPRKGGGRVDRTSIKAFSTYFIEGIVFPAATDHLPYESLAPEFIKDRSSHRGVQINVQAIIARREETKSSLSAYISMFEEQVTDGREWIMDTETPSLADISAYFVFSWMRNMKTLVDLFDSQTFPKTFSWLSRISAYLDILQKANVAPFEKMSADAAANLIGASSQEDLSSIGFDDVEAARLGLKQGETVSVTPRDTGKVPTVGRLVALNREEIVIETQGSAHAVVRCHFPRLGFSVKSRSAHAKL